MSLANQTFRGSATLSPPTTPTIYNVAAALANTEYSQAMSAGTKKFMVQCRGTASLSLYFSSGASDVLTIPAGASYTEENVNFGGIIYFKASKASQTIEIAQWV